MDEKVLADEREVEEQVEEEASREETAPAEQPKAETEPQAEAKAEAEPQPEAAAEPEPAAEDEPEAEVTQDAEAPEAEAEGVAAEEAAEPEVAEESAEPEAASAPEETQAVEPAAAEAEATPAAEEAPVAEATPAAEEAPVAEAAKPVREKPKAKGKKAPQALPASDEELFQAGRSWYVVHTYSGYEDKVRTNLEQRIKSMDAQDLVFRVVVPSVEEMEIRDGQRRTVPKKIFPGYVLVQMITLKEEDARADEAEMARSNKAWMVVRNSPGVTGFVGSGTAPTPLDKEEVLAIMKQMRAEEPVVKVGFTTGQSVRVTDGPFADFVGVVDEINVEKGKVKVLVSMMGRETPVELDFLQVERL